MVLVRGLDAQPGLAFRAARRFGHRSAFAGQSFWWTVGGEGFEALALAVVGLPPPTLFAAMLTGAFAKAGGRWLTPLVRAGSATHVGLKRERNEDSLILRPEAGLWAVADGMGGHGGGDVASRMAVEALARLPVAPTGEERLAAVEAAAAAANRDMRAYAQAQGRDIVGTTLVALLIFGAHFACLWCGDSRAYLWRGGALRQLTRDHSEAQALVDRGVLDPDEAQALAAPQRADARARRGRRRATRSRQRSLGGRRPFPPVQRRADGALRRRRHRRGPWPATIRKPPATSSSP